MYIALFCVVTLALRCFCKKGPVQFFPPECVMMHLKTLDSRSLFSIFEMYIYII